MDKRRTEARTLVSGAVIATGLLLAGCTSTGPDEPAPVTTESQDVVTPAPSESTVPETPDADPGAKITFEQAATIATDKYGGTVTSVESDTHKGEPTWEVELKDTPDGDIEVDVSKATGDIVSFERDHH